MLGIIGGTGLTQLANLEITHRKVARTPYGEPSGALTFRPHLRSGSDFSGAPWLWPHHSTTRGELPRQPVGAQGAWGGPRGIRRHGRLHPCRAAPRHAGHSGPDHRLHAWPGSDVFCRQQQTRHAPRFHLSILQCHAGRVAAGGSQQRDQVCATVGYTARSRGRVLKPRPKSTAWNVMVSTWWA